MTRTLPKLMIAVAMMTATAVSALARIPKADAPLTPVFQTSAANGIDVAHKQTLSEELGTAANSPWLVPKLPESPLILVAPGGNCNGQCRNPYTGSTLQHLKLYMSLPLFYLL